PGYRPAPPGQRALPGAAGGPVPGSGRRGAGRLPPTRRPGQKTDSVGADQPRDRGRASGRQGSVQSGDCLGAVHQPQGGRVPPEQRVRQVRPARTAAAAAVRSAVAPARHDLIFRAVLPDRAREGGRPQGGDPNWGVSPRTLLSALTKVELSPPTTPAE